MVWRSPRRPVICVGDRAVSVNSLLPALYTGITDW